MRFKKLDSDSAGALGVDEVPSLPGLRQNPLVQRAFEVFDTHPRVDFEEFMGLPVQCQETGGAEAGVCLQHLGH